MLCAEKVRIIGVYSRGFEKFSVNLARARVSISVLLCLCSVSGVRYSNGRRNGIRTVTVTLPKTLLAFGVGGVGNIGLVLPRRPVVRCEVTPFYLVQ